MFNSRPTQSLHDCDECGKSFASRYNLTRHAATVHTKSKLLCPLCGKSFRRHDKLLSHQRRVHLSSQLTITSAPTTTTTLTPPTFTALTQPTDTLGFVPSSSSTETTHRLGPAATLSSFDLGTLKSTTSAEMPLVPSAHSLIATTTTTAMATTPTPLSTSVPLTSALDHSGLFPTTTSALSSLNSPPTSTAAAPTPTLPSAFSFPNPTATSTADPATPALPPVFTQTVGDSHEEKQSLLQLPSKLQDMYRKNWNAIKTHKRPGKHQTVYTHFWAPLSIPQWDSILDSLFLSQHRRFKINYSHSFVLRHKENNQLSFFHACGNNNAVLEKPVLINNKHDFQTFLSQLQNQDHLENAQSLRPNSKYSVEAIASTSFYVSHLCDFPIGCCLSDLPDFLSNNKAIYTLQKDYAHSFSYTDNLCFFRCLALKQGASLSALQKPTCALFSQWQSFSSLSVSSSAFAGVTFFELPALEACFSINIDVFEFDETHTPPSLFPKIRSSSNYTDTLQLVHYKKHFMYITDINKVAHAFSCLKCGKLWKSRQRMHRHEQTCNGGKPKVTYSGGVYTTAETVFESLARYGLAVDTHFIFPYRATFDYEVYFDQSELPSTSDKTSFTARHVPLSVSIASNVPSFTEPVCFVTEGNPQDLIDRMIDYLEQISKHSYHLLRDQFQSVFDALVTLIHGDNKQGVPAKMLAQRLDAFLSELPVVGFNSGKYDINVIKPFLIRRLLRSAPVPKNRQDKDGDYNSDDDDDSHGDDEDETDQDKKKNKSPLQFVVKRNNDFLCISTPTLRFLDIVNFIAPGFSYAKYLAAYGITEQKGFFPYEYLTSYQQLNESCLPPHEQFYSSLKQSNISAQEYAFCQKVWTDHHMTTLRDFLVWYNNLDVLPFLAALEKQSEFYATLHVDMLKDAISVPGITLRYLFKTIPPHTYFSLFGDKQKDIHTMLRDNITGGPSIIFHRHHEKDKTRIRGDKPVQSLLGYDANALYLWALMQDMPCEHPIVRKKENLFRAEVTDPYGQQCREWLEYVMHIHQGLKIQHKFNGKEHHFKNNHIRVDGWDAASNTVYQFHGCLFHGHDCHLTDGMTTNPVNGKPLTELRTETKRVTDYLLYEAGVKVNVMWECEWRHLKKTDQQLSDFLRSHFPPTRAFYCSKEVTEESILAAIQDGSLFGLVQCDIEVPPHLRDYFSEMPPVFKNTEVSKSDIGDYMAAYATQHKLLSSARRTLIGSYFGKNIVLATPLLHWYLKKGLVVTNISCVIEYKPIKCFEAFGHTVSDARRQGDHDSNQAILAETFKLLGNSAYGKTLTNVAKHRQIHYVGDAEVQKLINDGRFIKMTELEQGIYEIEMAKKKILWALPLQIGYFVYQYAKLRMLEFHYDFIDTFLSRSDYQLCEMDTDSLYMALSTPTLEKAVRPDLRLSFYQNYHLWFPSPSCDQHRSLFVEQNLKDLSFTPCDLCLTRLKYDQRTPGLFKTEFTGDGIVALCSKTYFCFGQRGTKRSHKGLSKAQNSFNFTNFSQVLETQKSSGGVNTGFRTNGTTMYTYTQQRDSLSFFYIKRKVHADGVSTSPLDI